jgi:hypothetical protein
MFINASSVGSCRNNDCYLSHSVFFLGDEKTDQKVTREIVLASSQILPQIRLSPPHRLPVSAGLEKLRGQVGGTAIAEFL